MLTYILIALVLLTLAAWRGGYFLLTCRQEHPLLPRLQRYRYAHRGLHGKGVPENSLAAFRLAAEQGLGAELDVHRMKDGNLAVIHDSSLLRTAGVDVRIEDLTVDDLPNYPLEGTDQTIPLLRDVLDLYAGRAPLIVEVKPENNIKPLCEAVGLMLSHYDGDYCVECFDPRVLLWFRDHRPEMCRGQLAQNFLRHCEKPLNWFLKVILTHLLPNGWTRPDFVAYCYEDRKTLGLRLCRKWHKPAAFFWTITSQTDMDQAEKEEGTCIFEGFEPK